MLVTGAFGHIGSNLTLALLDLGAHVTTIDNSEPGCGANAYNLASATGVFEHIHASIADTGLFAEPLARAEVIFNLAGELSHSHSMLFPERDLAINTTAQLAFLRAAAQVGNKPRIVFTSTRQVYGRAETLPVSETHPLLPPDFNAAHKLAAEDYHLLLGRHGHLDPIVLRMSNVIGPRMAIGLACQGFLGEFTRRAVLGEPITVYGDGEQLRDPLATSDAVQALLLAGAVTQVNRRVLNIGSGEGLTLNAIAQEFCQAAGLPEPEPIAFPPNRATIDIGSYVTDTTAVQEDLDWSPTTPFRKAVQETLNYFRAESPRYLPGHCPLEHK